MQNGLWLGMYPPFSTTRCPSRNLTAAWGREHINEIQSRATKANARDEHIVALLPEIREINRDTFEFALNEHQKSCADTEGSVFLQAPTGSGKT
ncbi:MAG: DEAD/DEAH box helicase family protein, partial [Actinomycetota bacterium]|nr:DEAD/DEAH box helicase family protein [Actinomycetota bacterium]